MSSTEKNSTSGSASSQNAMVSLSNAGNQLQNLISTLSSLSNITKMKANIDHYRFSIQRSEDGPTIDFELRGEMVSKEPVESATNVGSGRAATSSSSSPESSRAM